MDYRQAMAYLRGLTDNEALVASAADPNRFQLGRVVALLEQLGHPERRFAAIHVVGTKGKGSTAAMLASSLRAAGCRVGLYTSPHLHSFRERIRVDDRDIPPDDVAQLVEDLRPLVSHIHAHHSDMGQLTTFEVATALALSYFAAQRVDWAVLEAGLGGRLDATNAVSSLATVFTPISRDHTQYLGDSIAAIAREKAAVIKPGGLAVSALQPPEARAIIEEEAARVGAELRFVGEHYRWEGMDRPESGRLPRNLFQTSISSPLGTAPPPGIAPSIIVRGPEREYREVHVPLLGTHQLENAALVVAALDALRTKGVVVPAAAIREGIATVRWPGRLEVLGERPILVLDGAHNQSSMRRLCEALADLFGARKRVFVLGSSADKDLAGIAGELPPGVRVIVTQARHPRAADAASYARLIAERGIVAETAVSVPAALERARALAKEDDLICVTGSLFVVAEARAEILGMAGIVED